MKSTEEKAERGSQFERTDKAIIRSFCELLQRKSFEALTVQDLLEETPVSRATFYKHFKDKYDIAERLLAEYQEIHRETVNKLKGVRKTSYSQIIQEAFRRNQVQLEALMKIHTDEVDLQRTMEEQYQKAYLVHASSDLKEVEAQVYARTMVAYHLASLRHTEQLSSAAAFDQVMIEVFLRIMSWSGSKEMRQYLRSHIVEPQK